MGPPPGLRAGACQAPGRRSRTLGVLRHGLFVFRSGGLDRTDNVLDVGDNERRRSALLHDEQLDPVSADSALRFGVEDEEPEGGCRANPIALAVVLQPALAARSSAGPDNERVAAFLHESRFCQQENELKRSGASERLLGPSGPRSEVQPAVPLESRSLPARREMRLTIETELEDDRRWIAEVGEIPGVAAYGESREDATRRVKALALRVVAEHMEQGGRSTRPDTIRFGTA